MNVLDAGQVPGLAHLGVEELDVGRGQPGQLDVGDGRYPGQVGAVALDGLGPHIAGPSLAFDPGRQVLAQGRLRPTDASHTLAARGL